VKDYYATLRVSPSATQLEIKQAYRREIQFFHPDRFPTDHPMHREAEKRTKEVNEAYEILGDPVKRIEYNILRQRQNGAPSFTHGSQTWATPQEPLWHTQPVPRTNHQSPPTNDTGPDYDFEASKGIPTYAKWIIALVSIAVLIVIIPRICELSMDWWRHQWYPYKPLNHYDDCCGSLIPVVVSLLIAIAKRLA